MTTPSAYVFSAYSFILTLPEDEFLKVGDLSADGTPLPSFDEDLLIQLCEDATKVFQNEQNIINLDGDVIVVGDIHGSLHDLLRILRYIFNAKCKVVFLGDYVDRGCFSLECVTLLFSLCLLHPDTFFLLRGNHEFDEMCSHYGFKSEILNYHNPMKPEHNSKFNYEEEKTVGNDSENGRRYSYDELCDNYFANHVDINCYKYTENLYTAFMKAFSFLPICAIINQTSICLHGGLSPLFEHVESIRTQIKRPINEFIENELFSDILWGDPSINLRQNFNDNQRGRGKNFNGPAVVNFLKNNNLKRLIRGHECVLNGIEILFNEKCITVFSASSYSGDMSNSSGILIVFKNNDAIQPVKFPPIHRLKKCDTSYYKVQAFNHHETHHLIHSMQSQSVSDHKNGSLSSFIRISNTHSETSLPYHHFLPSMDDGEKKGVHDMPPTTLFTTRNLKNHPYRISSLRSGPRRKINVSRSTGHVINTPHIFTPQTHQSNEFTKSESGAE